MYCIYKSQPETTKRGDEVRIKIKCKNYSFARLTRETLLEGDENKSDEIYPPTPVPRYDVVRLTC